jgi:hypothetical protein
VNLSDGSATAVERIAKGQLSAPAQNFLIFSVSMMMSKIDAELDSATQIR